MSFGIHIWNSAVKPWQSGTRPRGRVLHGRCTDEIDEGASTLLRRPIVKRFTATTHEGACVCVCVCRGNVLRPIESLQTRLGTKLSYSSDPSKAAALLYLDCYIDQISLIDRTTGTQTLLIDRRVTWLLIIDCRSRRRTATPIGLKIVSTSRRRVRNGETIVELLMRWEVRYCAWSVCACMCSCCYSNANSNTIHGGRGVNALACSARNDGFAPHLRRHFRDLFLEPIQSPARRDLKWSVWH